MNQPTVYRNTVNQPTMNQLTNYCEPTYCESTYHLPIYCAPTYHLPIYCASIHHASCSPLYHAFNYFYCHTDQVLSSLQPPTLSSSTGIPVVHYVFKFCRCLELFGTMCTKLFGATAPVVVLNRVSQLLLIMSNAAARKIDLWFFYNVTVTLLFFSWRSADGKFFWCLLMRGVKMYLVPSAPGKYGATTVT